MEPSAQRSWWLSELLEQRTLWALVLVTGVLLPLLTAKSAKPGEFYPLSNFPMYASFEEETYYVFISDLSDRTLNVADLFGLPISNVKKIYDNNLTSLKKETGSKERRAALPLVYREQAAQDTLALLIKNAPMQQRPHISTLSGLRLHQVDIRMKDGRIQKQTLPIGEMVVNSAAVK
jgi:hypothetical protein